MTKIRLDQFNHSLVDRGRGRTSEILWILAKWMFFETTLPWPNRFKAALLRVRREIGQGVVIRPWVNIHFPWKFSVGDHCWIGEGCQILNIAPVTFESQVALAHDIYVAAGGHDIRSATMSPKNEPILIKSGTWIASRAVIGPGVTIHEDVVVGAGAVVMKDVEASVIVVGNPAQVLRPRVIDRP